MNSLLPKETVLVIGSGGREHALSWKLSRSPRVKKLIIAPGNGGFDPDWERWDINLGAGRGEFEKLAARALDARVSLTVVGPDNPLADGIVDVFQKKGLLVFGPTQAAAQIEASKAFAKEVMKSAGVSTAGYHVVESYRDAERFLTAAPWPPSAGTHGWVIKADGLALGKGVVVCSELAPALEAAKSLIQLSGRLVIEERLIGEEVTWMAFCEGENCSLLEPARDHKRLKDHDLGPNTGGMGAFSPVPGMTAELGERIRKEVFLPVLQEMIRRGSPFEGLLYAGLMVDLKKNQFWVIEFNARFGDPETQVVVPRIADDLYDWCEAVAMKQLSLKAPRVPALSDHVVVVVGAAPGYPDRPTRGLPVTGPWETHQIEMQSDTPPAYFFAGVSKSGTEPNSTLLDLVTSGGRVLGAIGTGNTIEAARHQAYERIHRVQLKGIQFRSDIAQGQN